MPAETIKRKEAGNMESATIKQYICVCLLLVCMVSATMTGTLAWHDYSQHKSNEFWGMNLTQVERGQAVLEKLDKETSEPLPGAVFELYRVAEEGDDTLIGSYTTGEDGRIRAEGLIEGSYYWLETDPSYGYTYDKGVDGLDIKKYPFEVVAGESGEIPLVTVRAYNERQKADLIIIKRVEEAGSPDEEGRDGEDGADTGAGGGGQDTGEEPDPPAGPGGPAGPGEDQGGEDQGGEGRGGEGRGGADQGGADQGADEEAAPSAGDSGQAEDEEAAAPPIRDGEEGAIYVGGPEEGQGGEAESGEDAGDGEAGGPDPETGGGQDEPGGGQGISPLETEGGPLSTLFRFTITFTDLEDGPVTVIIDEAEHQMEIVEGKLVVELKHGQSATIKDLPVGTEYKVEEEPVDGYVVWSENEEGVIPPEGITVLFINYYQGEAPGKLIVEKIVTGDDADPDMEFGFKVTINGEETSFTLKAGEKKEFELPPNATYLVTEDDYTKDGYESSFTTEYYVDEDGTAVVHVKWTNDYTGPVQVEIEGKKTWDLSGVNVVLTGSIIVYLKDGDTTVDTIVVTPDEKGEWHYRFTAPKYRADGTEIVYTVEEVPIPGFYTTYDGYDIRNTYVPPETIVIPPVEKTITGNPGEDVTFTFRLTGLANAPMPEGSTNGQKTISIKGAGTADFGQIKFNRVGTYHYTITEIKGDRPGWTYDKTIYNLTVTVTERTGRLIADKVLTKADETQALAKAVFTNKYKKPEEPPKPPKPPEEPTKPPTQPTQPTPPPQGADSPRTGDDSNVWLWAIMMIVSAIALRFLLLYRKPEKE